MLNEALPQIRKVNSTCIPSAIQRLKEAVIDAKTHSKHILAFVTGIPGSGKTFLGLQFAHSIKDEKNHKFCIPLWKRPPYKSHQRQPQERRFY